MRGLSGDLPIAGKGDGAVNRQRKKGGTFSRLLGYVGRQPVPLIGVFACALVGNTAIQIAPRLVGKAIDLIVPSLENDFFPALLRTLAVIGALYLTGALLNWLTALCANLVANRTVKALRIDLFNKLGELPLQYDQIDASFLPDPAASIAMNARHRSLISTQELGIDFTVTAFSREAINEKRREIELLITGYNLGIDYIKMHPQKEWKQVLIDIGVPENLTGLIALPVYRKAERPSADALDKAVTWLKTNNRISQTYSGYKNLIDTTFTKTNSTTIK